MMARPRRFISKTPRALRCLCNGTLSGTRPTTLCRAHSLRLSAQPHMSGPKPKLRNHSFPQYNLLFFIDIFRWSRATSSLYRSRRLLCKQLGGLGAKPPDGRILRSKIRYQVTAARAWYSGLSHSLPVITSSITSQARRTSTSSMKSGVKPKRMMSGARKSPMTPRAIRACMAA